MWDRSHVMWAGAVGRSQRMWAQNRDVIGPSDLCSRAATASYTSGAAIEKSRTGNDAYFAFIRLIGSAASLSLMVFQSSVAADYTVHTFEKIQLTDKFWAEGAAIGDINRDGHSDVIAGPYWYESPDFKKRHEFHSAAQTFERRGKDGKHQIIPGFEGALGRKNAYSNNFFTFVYDFNHDGWPDILTIGFPGKAATWYENPGQKGLKSGKHWKAHIAFDSVDNESPTWVDLFGDGRPVLLCMSGGFVGYASPNSDNPTGKWKFHAISPRGDYQQFTHGLGYGDVNGDGRADILEANGWWEQPAVLTDDPVWRFHRQPFNMGGSQKETYGGSQMYTYDVNGDGLPDVIAVLAAHNYGLVWYEQLKDRDANGEIQFRQHFIINRKPSDNKYGVAFSEMHAVALADIDGDGLQDIVDFIPYLIDDNSGVGTQVVVGDVNGDGLPDIVVSNKKGTFLFLHKVEKVSKEQWDRTQPKTKFTVAEGGAH